MRWSSKPIQPIYHIWRTAAGSIVAHRCRSTDGGGPILSTSWYQFTKDPDVWSCKWVLAGFGEFWISAGFKSRISGKIIPDPLPKHLQVGPPELPEAWKQGFFFATCLDLERFPPGFRRCFSKIRNDQTQNQVFWRVPHPQSPLCWSQTPTKNHPNIINMHQKTIQQLFQKPKTITHAYVRNIFQPFSSHFLRPATSPTAYSRWMAVPVACWRWSKPLWFEPCTSERPVRGHCWRRG